MNQSPKLLNINGLKQTFNESFNLIMPIIKITLFDLITAVRFFKIT